ncbi:MAG: ABC transporter substrate-binding protein, partial [Caldivirga sp.]
KDAVDPSWALTCMPVSNPKYTMAAYSTEYEFGIGWGGIKEAYSLLSYMGAFAPPGQIPPLAQAIINGSLWTKTPQFAAFIGLPTPDPELQACVASYFHTTYTPVTTTTTSTTTTTTTTTTAVSTVTSTTTVTSTVTTTAVSTTTAVTTVTVTKPVISTTLIAGIVVIVVVVAAVAALIALRRR